MISIIPSFSENRNRRSLSPSTMELGICSVVSLLILSSLTFQLTSAENSVSVLFLDSQSRQYFRRPSTSDDAQSQTMLLPEVGAAVSVLLGLTPPATITAASSSKLNEVLAPNPFDRPRTVFLLEVSGAGPTNLPLNNVFTSKIITGSDKADIQLPDRDEISVVSLDERQGDFSDKEISDFASWLAGSYENDDINGKLTVLMANGVSLDQLSKKTDRKLVESLLVLFRNTKTAIEMHEDMPLGMQKPAELMMGHFDGVEVLQEDYNSERAQQMSELLLLTVSKLFDRLQLAHKGQIAGVILFNNTPSSVPNTMLNVMFTSQPSARWLVENDVSSINPTRIAEVVLVRLTLAWLTGIILVISTLLGIYFLLNMPLTRDTLLYSNVKLD